MKTTDSLKPNALYWWSSGSGRVELRMPGALVAEMSHSGDCDHDVSRWANDPRIVWHRGTAADIREELDEYGAWDADELVDEAANRRRLLWLAACDIREQDDPDCSAPVTNTPKAKAAKARPALPRPPAMPRLSEGSSRYGAQMGRRNAIPESLDARAVPCLLRLVRLKWIDGDYDQAGAYWGATRAMHWRGPGARPVLDYVYRATGEIGAEAVEVFVRAVSRSDAKAKVRKTLTGAEFLR